MNDHKQLLLAALNDYTDAMNARVTTLERVMRNVLDGVRAKFVPGEDGVIRATCPHCHAITDVHTTISGFDLLRDGKHKPDCAIKAAYDMVCPPLVIADVTLEYYHYPFLVDGTYLEEQA